MMPRYQTYGHQQLPRKLQRERERDAARQRKLDAQTRWLDLAELLDGAEPSVLGFVRLTEEPITGTKLG